MNMNIIFLYKLGILVMSKQIPYLWSRPRFQTAIGLTVYYLTELRNPCHVHIRISPQTLGFSIQLGHPL